MFGHWAQRPKAVSHAEMMSCQNAGEVHDSQHQDSSAVSATANDPASVPRFTAPHYPAHFTKGSIIQLANGELKRIEDLSTEDFVRSADISKDLCIDTSVVRGITPLADRGTVMLEFSVGHSQVQVSCRSHAYLHSLCVVQFVKIFTSYDESVSVVALQSVNQSVNQWFIV